MGPMTQTLEMPHLPQNKTEKNKKKLVKSRQASAIGLAFPCSNLQQIFSFLQFLQKQLHAEKKLLQIQVVHPCLVHFFCYTPKNKPSLIYVIIFNPFKTLEFINSNNFLKTKFYKVHHLQKNCRRMKKEKLKK